ncbi:sigma-E factor negative regulatory protein RseB [Spinactinospora alkalitolerans]|uniref:Sigma-E factor negative regulatory protein RseB n=1 Tax=Spinactinospora alkalitolerans TaxID=687207 RepID=A0A852TQZ3_9ACTN|nr:sigma-E factor regulatory protein RseB domain-containing protein [Spinactinospora alkalitolerans]NYE45717.1 sigma-E factor negative regulatory protein RseB [Spinactinospora alkalitolerans]
MPATTILLCSVLCLLTLTTSGGALAGAPGRPHQDDSGMGVLRRAAKAGQEVAYEGVQFVSSRNGHDTATGLVDIVHRPGEGTSLSPAEPAADREGLVAGPPSSWPDLDDRLLDLLGANYRVVRTGQGEVCGRAATVVEAHRADGSVAGRFWTDDETGLLLRRETFDSAGRVAQSGAFLSIDLAPDAVLLTDSDSRGRLWGDTLDAAERVRLESGGWRLPERLAAGLALVETRSTGSGADRIVHLSYSDGLSLVSVFVQQGRLEMKSGGSAGLRPVHEDGGTVYVAETGQHRRIWEAGGFVYTLMADAPTETVETAAEGLPSPDGSGFWARVLRGFTRFGTWLGLTAP